MSFSNPILPTGGTSAQSVYSVATTPLHLPGTRAMLQDGRVFEYVRSKSATAIGKGKLASYDPIVAAIDKLTGVATDLGSTTTVVSVTATLALNELAGGYLSVDLDPGQGEMYRILGNYGAGTAGAHTTGNLTLTLDRPLAGAALTTTSRLTIQPNATSVIISTAVTAQALPVEVAAGVTLVDVPAGSTTPQYFWAQKAGLANVLFSAAVGAIGRPVYQGADAGSFQVANLDVSAAADLVQFPSLGTIVTLLPITTQHHTVRLNIA